MTSQPAGRAIFLNGIPSSGKSSVAEAIHRRASTFRILTGDDVIRQVPFAQRLAMADELFARTLDMVGEWLASGNVVVDGAWREAQVSEAQKRFAGAGLYVVLRIDEAERKRREAVRRDRRLPYWDPAWHSMPGPDDLYDVVIDANRTRPAEAGALVLDEAMSRWSDILV